MTREQAMQKALDAGMLKEDVTDADLAEFGYEAPDPTAGMPSAPPAVTDAQVTQDVADAQAEAAGNTTGAQVLQGAAKAASVAGTLLGASKAL